MVSDNLEIVLDESVNGEREKVKEITGETNYNVEESEKPTPRHLPQVQREKNDLYTIVFREFAKNTKNTEEQMKALDAYETAVSVFRATSRELLKKMDVITLERQLSSHTEALAAYRETNRLGDEDKTESEGDAKAPKKVRKQTEVNQSEGERLLTEITDAKFLSNRWALYLAGQVGLALLNKEPAKVFSTFGFGGENERTDDRDTLTSILAGFAAKDVSKRIEDVAEKEGQLTDTDLTATMEATFTSWTNQFNWNTLKPIAEKRGVSELKLKFGNYSMAGGDFKKKSDIVVMDERIMPVHRDDVVGNEEFTEVLWKYINRLRSYNHDKRKNPQKLPLSIFVHGPPGCGKTFPAHAYMRSFVEEVCIPNRIPIWALTHSVTDFASSFQNQSAGNLAKLADDIRNFPGAVIMYMADADIVFQSRKDAQATQEQKQTMGVYFGMFDGTRIPKIGKLLLIADANYTDTIDDATKSRVFGKTIALNRFTKPEHFANLIRKTLTKGLNDPILKDNEWLEIGKYLLQTPLNNREITNTAEQLQDETDVPEEFYQLRYDDQIEYMGELMRKNITKERVIGIFEKYIESRRKIEAASDSEKGRDDSERFERYKQFKEDISTPYDAAKQKAGVKSVGGA